MYKSNFIKIGFGNEDKWEECDTLSFEHPSDVASFLRKVASNIEQYETSKKYRASDNSIFDGIDLEANLLENTVLRNS